MSYLVSNWPECLFCMYVQTSEIEYHSPGKGRKKEMPPFFRFIYTTSFYPPSISFINMNVKVYTRTPFFRMHRSLSFQWKTSKQIKKIFIQPQTNVHLFWREWMPIRIYTQFILLKWYHDVNDVMNQANIYTWWGLGIFQLSWPSNKGNWTCSCYTVGEK